MKTEESKMVTAKEYAEMRTVHYTTVMNWLRRDLVPSAIKEELPFGGYFYKIPAGALIPELKPGPITFVERLRAIAAEILFAQDGRGEARLEKIREERSASEMNPLNLSKSELEKFGVTYKDTTPDQGGGIKRKIAPRLVCNQCGRSWRLPLQKGERSLPNGYWICPKGCNNQ